MIIETHSEQETWEVGKKLAAQAKPGPVSYTHLDVYKRQG